MTVAIRSSAHTDQKANETNQKPTASDMLVSIWTLKNNEQAQLWIIFILLYWSWGIIIVVSHRTTTETQLHSIVSC